MNRIIITFILALTSAAAHPAAEICDGFTCGTAAKSCRVLLIENTNCEPCKACPTCPQQPPKPATPRRVTKLANPPAAQASAPRDVVRPKPQRSEPPQPKKEAGCPK